MGDLEGSFCCFLDPQPDYASKRSSDTCPCCGRTYAFPLTDAPTSIGLYTALHPIGRGFYAATYTAEVGRLRRKVVLKVVPTAVYRKFAKDFDQEVSEHAEVAALTEHLVGIEDAFDADVEFGDVTIPCHVAVLQYVDGVPLSDFLRTQRRVTAQAIAQIAIDLFRLMAELEGKRRHHNDLHAGNIIVQRLPPSSTRAEAIDGSLRAVAIDLGSISDASRSDGGEGRLGDLASVVRHILAFREVLLSRPDNITDLEYRLAGVLDEIAHSLSPDPVRMRTPNYADIIEQIGDAFHLAASPWARPTPLKRLNDAYNAQTLHPWYVPRLLVDPNGEWVTALSSPGPQVITGIRGCGKTMLLRALQFHARASAFQLEHETQNGPGRLLEDFLADDGYLGLYVSCNRLLDPLGTAQEELHQPYARLFLAYAREAVRAARHLRELRPDLVAPLYWRPVAATVDDYVKGPARLANLSSDLAFERSLQQMLASLDRGEESHVLATSPGVAFPALAEAIARCSRAWATSAVFFLLDDVSTRHLKEASIADLLGTLLFSHPQCAFKMTTEVQTLELALRSPGLIEKARAGRDYETFELAPRVSEKLRQEGGVQFMETILEARAEQFANHPQAAPKELLGDVVLEDIARDIAMSGKTSAEKKQIYRGIRCLAAVCVGDIGDAISIYDLIIRRRDESLPISARVQSECFQEYCSRRLYHLNRRGGHLKDYALSFSSVAHDLLLRSALTLRDPDNKRMRLRQYTQVYVRLTEGDTEAQFEKLRELTDAGVFVLEGGTEAPRTKTKDADPIHQFNLSFRKLFGISSFIGLADSDRFELSGKDLEEWLAGPERAREVLVRNLGGPLTPHEQKELKELPNLPADDRGGRWLGSARPITTTPAQLTLDQPAPDPRRGTAHATAAPKGGNLRLPLVQPLTDEDAGRFRSVVLALGFEERAVVSAERLFSTAGPETTTLVRYPRVGAEEDRVRAVQAMAMNSGGEVGSVDASDILAASHQLPPGPVLVDVTGLSKNLIFRLLRNLLLRDHEVGVWLTPASSYYPLESEVQAILSRELDDYRQLSEASTIWSGDVGPYTFDKLLRSDADDSRPRLLVGAASSKHERLLSLVDERSFDLLSVLTPSGDTARARLAHLAAEVATREVEGSRVVKVDLSDPGSVLSCIGEEYLEFYVQSGFGIELALTGSKSHAVACAAAASVLKFSQCWYVRPRSFDPARFTKGASVSRAYRIVGGHLAGGGGGSVRRERD